MTCDLIIIDITSVIKFQLLHIFLCLDWTTLTTQHPPSTCYTRSMKESLKRYRKSFPENDMYDISQSLARARTDLKNGDLLCLATSSTFLWSETLGRCMSGKEKLKTLLYPIENHEDVFNEIPESALTKFSGNGMFLPNIGWALLCSTLCALPIEQWKLSVIKGYQRCVAKQVLCEFEMGPKQSCKGNPNQASY